MIRETALMFSDPFLIAREQAEDLFDHRFQDAEKDCKHCEGIGWRLEDAMEVYKCGKCQGGTIYFEACCRCHLPESECECSVSDFI